jgi:hypothetical protein
LTSSSTSSLASSAGRYDFISFTSVVRPIRLTTMPGVPYVGGWSALISAELLERISPELSERSATLDVMVWAVPVLDVAEGRPYRFPLMPVLVLAAPADPVCHDWLRAAPPLPLLMPTPPPNAYSDSSKVSVLESLMDKACWNWLDNATPPSVLTGWSPRTDAHSLSSCYSQHIIQQIFPTPQLLPISSPVKGLLT